MLFLGLDLADHVGAGEVPLSLRLFESVFEGVWRRSCHLVGVDPFIVRAEVLRWRDQCLVKCTVQICSGVVSTTANFAPLLTESHRSADAHLRATHQFLSRQFRVLTELLLNRVHPQSFRLRLDLCDLLDVVAVKSEEQPLLAPLADLDDAGCRVVELIQR